jgi:hypothetical protein
MCHYNETQKEVGKKMSTTGCWTERLDALDGAQFEGKERHTRILHNQIMSLLAGTSRGTLNAGDAAHKRFGEDMDGVIESLVIRLEKDGTDVDSELLDDLISLASMAHAVDTQWEKISKKLQTA